MNRDRLEDLPLRDLRLFSQVYAGVRDGFNLQQIEEGDGWTGPTIRNFLGKLEKKLRTAGVLAEGTHLVRRTRRNQSACPTPEGDDFFAYAFEVVSAHERAASEHQDRRQTLHLWAEPTAATFILPRLLRDYLPRSEYRYVRVTERSAPEIVDAVHLGLADLGLAVSQPHHRHLADVRADALYEFARTLVVCKDHPLRGEVKVSRLARECLLTFPASDLRSLGIAESLPPPDPRGVRVYLDSTQTILEWVRLGLGVGMGTTVQSMLTDVRPIDVAGERTLVTDRVMLYSAGADLEGPLAGVREAIRTTASDIWRPPPATGS